VINRFTLIDSRFSETTLWLAFEHHVMGNNQNQITASDISDTKSAFHVYFSGSGKAGDLADAARVLKGIVPLDVDLEFVQMDWDVDSKSGVLVCSAHSRDGSDFPWLSSHGGGIRLIYVASTPDGESKQYAIIQAVEGSVYILDILFKLRVGKDSFKASMAAPKALKVKDLLKPFMGGDIDLHMPKVGIVRAEFEYHGGSEKIISLDVEASGSIKLWGEDKFALNDIGFHIQIWDKALSCAKLYATSVIGGKQFYLSGEYELDGGFTFTFNYIPDEAGLDLNGLLGLLQHLADDSGVRVPDGLKPSSLNLTVKILEFSINSRTKAIHFKIEAECDWGNSAPHQKLNGKKLDVQFTIDGSADKQAGIPFVWEFDLDLKLECGSASAKTFAIKLKHDDFGLSASFDSVLNEKIASILDVLVHEFIDAKDDVFDAFISPIGQWEIEKVSLSSDPYVGKGFSISIKPEIEEAVNKTRLLNFVDILDGLDIKAFDKNEALKAYELSELSIRYSQLLGFSVRLTISKGTAKYNFKGSKHGELFVGGFYTSNEKGLEIPILPIDLSVKDIFFAHRSADKNSKTFTVFGADMDLHAELDFSDLPVVGKFFSDVRLGLEGLRVAYANNDIAADVFTDLNQLIGALNIPPLTLPESKPGDSPGTPVPYKKGISLQGTLVVGDDIRLPLNSLMGGASAPPDPPQDSNATGSAKQTVPSDSPVTPTPVGHQFGPVHLQSVSLGMKGGKVNLLISGGLIIGPVDFELIGLQVSSPPKTFDPTFDLQGLSLGINKPPLLLKGMFAKAEIDVSYNDTVWHVPSYTGELIVGYNEFQFLAVGSYASVDGHPSIFFYGFLGAPIVGLPPLITISGLALGFGYNRRLVMPQAKDVDNFVLVEPIVKGVFPEFAEINKQVPVSIGDYWAAIGLQIESLNMVHGLLVLDVQFGHELEIDILGHVDMTYPKTEPGIPALSKISIGVVARILPDRGVISVKGELQPGSYVYNPSVVLSGGFAFLMLSKDQSEGEWQGGKEGEFVVTVGGYNLSYKPKPYYPVVPRLSIQWKPFSCLDVVGEMYFAVTPDAFMMGGHISANFQAGGSFSIWVHFEVGLDFLIYYQPMHYLGHAYASLHAGARIHVLFIHANVEFDLGADISFWGPDFAGHASCHIHVLVSISFGIDFGAGAKPLQPLSGKAFLDAFFPDPAKVLTAKVTSGIMSTVPDPADPANPANRIVVVNAKELCLSFTSLVPIKEINPETGLKVEDASKTFGVKPMANASNDVSSFMKITVTRDTLPYDGFSTHFTVELVHGQFPAALWETAATGGVIPANGPDPLMELCTGVTLKANSRTTGGLTIDAMQFDNINMGPLAWETAFAY
jgi:hypothetical protein